MSAHRARQGGHRAHHGVSACGLRPVSEILAQVAAGPGSATSSGAAAALPAQRCAFTLAAAAVVGAGTAAASVTGAFSAIGALPIPDRADPYSLSRIEEPLAASAPDTVLVTAAPNSGRSAAEDGRTGRPTALSSALDGVSGSRGASAGSVMATDSYQEGYSQRSRQMQKTIHGAPT